MSLQRRVVLGTIRLRAMFAVAAVMVMLASCSDSAITQVSKGLVDTAQALSAIQTTVIAGNKSGVISDGDTATILQLCFRINTAGQQAAAVTRQVNALDATHKATITAVILPIVAAVNTALTDNTLVNIKDQSVRTNIQLSLTAIQTALAIIQSATAH